MSKSQKEAMKDMTFKQKAEHIWEYYRLPIVSGIIALFFIGSLVNHYVINPPNKSYLAVSLYGNYVYDESVQSMQADLTTRFVPDDLKDGYEVTATNYAFSPEDPTINQAISTKFIAELQTQSLDLFIADEAYFADVVSQGILMPLSDYLPQGTLSALAESQLFEGAVLVYESGQVEPSSVEEEDFYGIRLDETAYLPSLGIVAEGKVIGLITNTTRPELSVSALQYIAGLE